MKNLRVDCGTYKTGGYIYIGTDEELTNLDRNRRKTDEYMYGVK